VYTTVDASKQQAARNALINGLLTYDRRHGWRGPERQLPPQPEEADEDLLGRWQEALADMPVIADLPPAIVTELTPEGAFVLDKSGELRRLDWSSDLSRIRRYATENITNPPAKLPEELLAVGDLIRIQFNSDTNQWQLGQVPAAQAALVSLDPHNGAIRALVGGMGFELSKFNRAIQARRQPGSNFKPFLYAAAIEQGVTASTLINDAPIVLDNLSTDEIWRPENDSGRFYGPTRLRNALTFSRNLVSIRVLQRVGLDTFIDYVSGLGFNTEDMARNLTLALGTHAFTPLEVATGYTILANGGFKVSPYLIERIADYGGETVYQADPEVACNPCDPEPIEDTLEPLRMEDILAAEADADGPRAAVRVMDERVAFIVTSMLKDVIQRGTGRKARALKRDDIAGKTGTTNGPRDAWFSGFNTELVATAWVGFDDYRMLGRREFGGTAALPIWIDYMGQALGPAEPTAPMPPGVVRLRVDAETGRPVSGNPKGSLLEYFLEEHLPTDRDTGKTLDSEDLEGLF